MDKATLRPYILEILKRTPQTHFHAIENDLRKLVESYQRHDILTLQEILWELLVQGILAPGKNSLNLNLPFVHLTEYGARCLEDGRILAHDPDRYMERLAQVVQHDVDPLIMNSVREALAVFANGSWASAVILLARAAELLFDQLSSMLQAHQDDAELLSTSQRFTQSQAQTVIQCLRQRVFPTDIEEAIEPQLNGLLALIQHSRNQEGSPRWPHPSRDQMLGFFLLFPDQCAVAHDLMKLIAGKTSP